MTDSSVAGAPLAEEILKACLDDAPVRLTVTGACLSPCLREGDKVVLHGRSRRLPRFGDVVLCAPQGNLRLHRLVWSPPWGRWRTKGDRTPSWDARIRPDEVLATVVAIDDGGEDRPLAPLRLRAVRSLASALLNRVLPAA
jgi:hypothetical protein